MLRLRFFSDMGADALLPWPKGVKPWDELAVYADSSKLKFKSAGVKKKYEAACHERRRDFTPLVYSVDGVPCEEARSAERRLAGLLAQKWERNYSEMCGYVRTRLSLSIIRSQTLLLRGERANTWRRRGAGAPNYQN